MSRFAKTIHDGDPETLFRDPLGDNGIESRFIETPQPGEKRGRGFAQIARWAQPFDTGEAGVIRILPRAHREQAATQPGAVPDPFGGVFHQGQRGSRSIVALELARRLGLEKERFLDLQKEL